MINNRFSLILSFYISIIIPAYAENEINWETVIEKENIHILTKHIPGSPIIVSKGITTLDTNPQTVLQILINNNEYKDWVPRLLDAHKIKTYSNNNWTEYILMNSPWPLYDREFVLEKEIKYGDDGSIQLKFKSIESGLIERNVNNVRATIYIGTVFLTLHKGNKTHVEIITHADLKGHIPTLIMNYIQKIWPLETLKALIKQANKINSS